MNKEIKINNINPVLYKKLEQVGISQFLEDDSITEIAISKPTEIWIKQDNWIKKDCENANLDNLNQLVQVIANSNDIRLEHSNPIISVQLVSGERVQVCISPATLPKHISINIRKHSAETKSLDQLESEQTFTNFKWIKKTKKEYSQENKNSLNDLDKQLVENIENNQIVQFLKLAINNHKNILIVGRTGSGKTFLTRSLIQEVPHHERIITIEDVHELFLPNHQNKVHLIFGEGNERVTAKKALSACMRMSPDRIFLAEIRGDEAWDYINSLNTGHPGSITSSHANGAIEAYTRVTSLIKSTPTGSTLDSAYIQKELYNTIHIVLYYENRKLKQLFFDPLYVQELF
jgi:type IV secretion system protein VirB11